MDNLYVFRSFIDTSKLVWEWICYNADPYMLSIIEKNTHLLCPKCWIYLSENPHAIQLLEQHLDKVVWYSLSKNPAAIHLLERYPENIDWYNLSANPKAVHLLEQHPDKINRASLMGNTGTGAMRLNSGSKSYIYKSLSANNSAEALHVLETYPNKIDWYYLSTNPKAIHLLEQYPDKINWKGLSYNPHPDAVAIMERNPEKIYWRGVTTNPFAERLLRANPDKIEWMYIADNFSPAIVDLLEESTRRTTVCWSMLSRNPNAIHIIERYPEHIDYFRLSANPNIITLNYAMLKARMDVIREGIYMGAFHPRRIQVWLDNDLDPCDM